jgi:hypothetical protein
MNRDDFCAILYLIQIICPVLHHLAAFGEVGRSVIRSPVGIAHGVWWWSGKKVRMKHKQLCPS